ncbi:pantoate--beta-alanine ligase [Desulfonema ishimotonii]|uniref:Pantothenate synthetase n=2 Tax=Desulfonema ishimotonii TaxID=45657 RepID=A0A401FVF8_9BACT|nr:pantoate--beta-alanine ligase [Desulfonema ishimotonii]
MQAFSRRASAEGKTIAFVPTMGFLHEGHLSLVREAGRHGDEVVVSIFVNPSQFAPGEDFDSYPRSFEKDCELARKAGATVIFNPRADDLYGPNYQTRVNLEMLPQHLCGISRPTFFRGVATVVTKLFNIVRPQIAVFGEKDYQQLLVIRQMVRDLNFDIEIIGGALVREPDGLAMSSRNNYLSPDERRQALSLSQSLRKAREQVESGVTDAQRIMDTAREIITAQPDAVIDYIAICDPEILDEMTCIDRPALMALAVRIGKTRLIDNMMLTPSK